MSEVKLFVSSDVLRVGDFPIEGHNRPEGVTLGHQSELTRCEIVGLTVLPHDLLLDCLQILALEVFDRQAHDDTPDALTVEEDTRVFLLLLSGVKVAPEESDDKLFKHPLEDLPQNPVVLVFKILIVILFAFIAHT